MRSPARREPITISAVPSRSGSSSRDISGRTVAIVSVQEHDDIRSIDRGKAGKTRAAIATPRLTKNLCAHITRYLRGPVG